MQVRKSMANKIKIPASDFSYYVIVVVFPNENSTIAVFRLRATFLWY